MSKFYVKRTPAPITQVGVLPEIRRWGLGPHIKFEGKIWGKVRPSHQIRGKFWEVLSPQDAKVRKKCCPNFAVISEIQRAKFGVFVTFIFGGKIWGSNKNFRGKFWGQAPPTSKYGNTPLDPIKPCKTLALYSQMQ